MSGQRRLSEGPNSPDVIIHSSLAQNLYSQFTESETAQSQRGPATARTSTVSKTSVSSTSTRPSPAQRDRTKSGAQTPREMVWVNSKERLSEMATNIRGISNALSNVALNVVVENILIVTKLSDDELPDLTRKIVEWLLLWKPFPDDPRRSETSSSAGSSTGSSTPDGVAKVTTIHKEGASTKVSTHSVEEAAGALEVAVEPKSCSSGNLNVYVEDEIATSPLFGFDEIKRKYPEESQRLKCWSPDTVGIDAEKIDLVLTLGGDGTVLYTSWLFQKMVPPTISFGLGSLGFMTEHEYEDFQDVLDGHLRDGICCTLRMRFACTVMRTKNPHKTGSDDLMHEMREGGESLHFTSHTRDGDHTILNEVVVDRGPNPFVAMTELYGNYELLTSIKADGVVISTPTGSTAYSMSAGGGLVHPDIPAQLISPICPHTLSFRPLVVPDSMILHIGVPYDARSSAFVSFDGKARVELRRGDFLAINVSRYPFPKVLPGPSTSVSWVQQLSRTLHWNEMKRPKRYTDGKTDNWTA